MTIHSPEASTPVSFEEYLAAKRTVDDRALNRVVYGQLVAALAAWESPEIRVLEVGCGSGTMIDRLAEWQPFPPGRLLRYLGIDSSGDAVAAARRRATTAACDEFAVLQCDLYSLAEGPQSSRAPFDLVIANAVLDLLDLERALPLLRALLRPGGLGWFTINFDGMTRLLPVIEPQLDAAIEAAYHQTMDSRMIDGRHSGDSHTGSRLLTALPAAGLSILAAGPSDWVVYPNRSGYPADEATFLRFIVQTMHGALRGHPNLDGSALEAWIARRHQQIDSHSLVYLAHQLDFLVQRPPKD